MSSVEDTLDRLARSRFRGSFHLSKKDKAYVLAKGTKTIQKHAEEFVRTRLAPKEIPNDGKQTPYRGHPVFTAQHACACCCRGCLEKWYCVPRDTPLSDTQQEKIVRLLLAWIKRECEY